MTSPADPTRPVAPTVREIAALTARLRDISARGRDVDPDERAAFLADKDALIARITDAPAERIGDLRAEHGPSSVEATITRAEAAQRLTELGHDPASAKAMVAEYLHETSRAVGVPVYQWGLDGHDVAAIAEQFAWVHDGNGQTLAQARDRAGGYAQYWNEQAAALDPEHHPREAEQVQRLITQWTDRAGVPEPFAHPVDDDGVERDEAVVDPVPSEASRPETDGSRPAAAQGRPDGGHVVIPEQDRREQLARWHADDQTVHDGTATAESFDGASLDLGRG
ncbi:hypothetical protein [Pseudonocardia sp.]|uniref:hypothetical protein n=1 Tax=Pseudonocardia sp. TaxID=60912 RepID=UPI00261F7A2D|nr:hypothetical protein [Pseudonocardia sp.]MCW2720613.1 hypothetical protein [Pseudonocardia sp.]